MVSYSNALKKTLKTLRWVIGIRKSQNDRQHMYNGQKKKTTIYKTLHKKPKVQATRTPLKLGGELGCSGRVRMQFLLH